MKKLIILLLFTTLNTIGFSQQIWFEKMYNFGHAEAGNFVVQTPDSGYVVAGREGIAIGDFKMLLIKTDKHGVLQWSNFIGSGTNEVIANSIINCSSGGYAAVGEISLAAYVPDIYVVRLNNNGDTIWTHHYGTPIYEKGTSIVETPNHNFAISFIQDNDTTGILEIDSLGNELWWKKYSLYYNTTNNNYFRSISLLADGGFVLSGVAQQTYIGSATQGIIMRTDSLGDSLWLKQFGGVGGDEFFQAGESPDGNIIVGGISAPNLTSGYGSHILKLDLNGNAIWTKYYGGGNTADDGCVSISNCSDGGYIIGGTVRSVGLSDDMFITRLNSNGDSLWTKSFGGPDADYGYSVKQTYDGGHIITGFNGTAVDVYLVKTDSLGNTDVGINEIAASSLVFSAYPNLTKDVIYLKTDEKEDYTVTIIDLGGRTLFETVVSKTNENKIDLSGYDNGIYFLKISSTKCNATKKIIKIE